MRMVWSEGEQVPAYLAGGRCEDAPCCGCCPGGMNTAEPYEEQDLDEYLYDRAAAAEEEDEDEENDGLDDDGDDEDDEDLDEDDEDDE